MFTLLKLKIRFLGNSIPFTSDRMGLDGEGGYRMFQG